MLADDVYYPSSPEVSSSYAVARRNVEDERGRGETAVREEEEEDEQYLELGLSLVAKKNRREYCRILTAKDFPSVVSSRVSPNSSSASSSFSFVGRGGGGGASAGADGGGSAAPSQVVGWPPIRSRRINNLFHQPKGGTHAYAFNAQEKKPVSIARNSSAQDVVVGSQGHVNKARSRFVKVNMDGVPIGRKVDLNAHRSYETLAWVLEDMFQSPGGFGAPLQSIKVSKLLDGSSEFVLTYEDKDGDWMLVGDVPWGMFLGSVRRLRIMRTSDTNGLGSIRQQPKGRPN